MCTNKWSRMISASILDNLMMIVLLQTLNPFLFLIRQTDVNRADTSALKRLSTFFFFLKLLLWWTNEFPSGFGASGGLLLMKSAEKIEEHMDSDVDEGQSRNKRVWRKWKLNENTKAALACGTRTHAGTTRTLFPNGILWNAVCACVCACVAP